MSERCGRFRRIGGLSKGPGGKEGAPEDSAFEEEKRGVGELRLCEEVGGAGGPQWFSYESLPRPSSAGGFVVFEVRGWVIARRKGRRLTTASLRGDRGAGGLRRSLSRRKPSVSERCGKLCRLRFSRKGPAGREGLTTPSLRGGRGRGALRRPSPAGSKKPAADAGSGRGRNGKDLGGCARGGGACATFAID